MTAASSTAPRLHIPDEPTLRRIHWRDAVLEGVDLAQVVGGPDGPAEWLWGRWRVLATAGIGRADLLAIVDGYRREIWLWLAGERTWTQCCSGLIGRIDRRTVGAP